MKRALLTALAGSGMLLMTMTANAQPPRSEGSYQRDPYERQMVSQDRMFDQIRGDLDLASTTALPFSGDKDRVSIARDQLSECQRAVNSGNYDRLTFRQVISSIQRVVDLNRVTDQNRSYLVNDMNQLRDLEARLAGS